jgi:hypothetical protein
LGPSVPSEDLFELPRLFLELKKYRAITPAARRAAAKKVDPERRIGPGIYTKEGWI